MNATVSQVLGKSKLMTEKGSSNSYSSNSGSSSSSQSLAPFLSRNPIKKLMKSHRQLYSFMLSALEPHDVLNKCIFAVHIIQIFAPSFMGQLEGLWDNKSLPGMTKTIFTAFIEFLPSVDSITATTIFSIIISSLCIGDILFSLLALYFFRSRHSYVPSWLMKQFSITDIFDTYPWQAISMTSFILIIRSGIDTRIKLAAVIFFPISDTLFSFVHIYKMIYTIFFIITPYQLVDVWVQLVIWYTPLVQCALAYLLPVVDGGFRLAFMIILALIYPFYFWIIYHFGHFTRPYEERICFSICVSGFVSSIFSIVYHNLGDVMPDYVTAIYAFVFTFSFAIYPLYQHYKTCKHLMELDDLSVEPENIKFYSCSRLKSLALSGFMNNHEYATSYSIFQDMELYKGNTLEILCLHAKFLTILPDSNSELEKVFQKMKQLKSSVVRSIAREQIRYLLMHRNTSMTPSLKIKIHRVEKHSQILRFRIKGMFETASNGNTVEASLLMNVIARQEVDIENLYAALLCMNGNNMHILHSQAKFYRNLSFDFKKYENAYRLTMEAIYRNKKVHDGPYLYGKLCFPYLAISKEPTFASNIEEANISTISSSSQFVEEGVRKSDVSKLIEATRIPSVFWSRILFSVGGPLLLIIPLILFPVITNIIHENLIESSQASKIVIEIRSANKKLHIFRELAFMKWEGANCANITFDPKEEAIAAYANASKLISNMTDFTTLANSGGAIGQMNNIIFFQDIEWRDFITPDQYVRVNRSLLSQIIYVIQSSYEAVLDPSKLNRTRISSNVLFSGPKIGDLLNQCVEIIESYVSKRSTTIANRVRYIFLGLIVSEAIVYVLSFWHLSRKVNKDREAVIRCFQAIPKSSISNMAAKVDIDVDITQENEDDIKVTKDLSPEEKDEEAFMVKLRTLSFSGIHYHDTVFIKIGLIMFILSALCVFIGSYFHIMRISKMKKIHPMAEKVMKVMDKIDSAFIYYILLRNYDLGYGYVSSNRTSYISGFRSSIEEALDALNLCLFGNQTLGMNAIIHEVNHRIKSDAYCKYDNLYGIERRMCLPLDDTFLVEYIELIEIYEKEIILENPLSFESERLNQVISVFMKKIYPDMIVALFERIRSAENNLLVESYNIFYLLIIVITSLDFVMLLYLLFSINRAGEDIRAALRLILNFRPSIVMNSRYIMAVIGENFKEVALNFQLRGSFSEAVIANEPYPIIGINYDNNKITNKNKAADNLQINIGSVINLFLDAIEKHQKEFEVEIEESKFRILMQSFDSESFFIIIPLKSEEDAKKMLLEEEKRAAELRSRNIPDGIHELAMSHTASLCIVNINCSPLVLCERASLILDAAESAKKSISDIEYVELVGNSIVAIAGFINIKKAQKSAEALVRFCLALLDAAKPFEVDLALHIGMIGQTYVTGVAIESAFELNCIEMQYVHKFASLSDPNSIVIPRGTYELIFGYGFNVTQWKKLIIDGIPMDSFKIKP